ncbi:hypothetical protein AB1Y20_017677 [Prymnesium parvum]
MSGKRSRSRPAKLKYASDDESSGCETGYGRRGASAKRVCSSSSASTSSTTSETPNDAMHEVNPMLRMDAGVEETLCEIFGANEGSTSPNSIAGALSIPERKSEYDFDTCSQPLSEDEAQPTGDSSIETPWFDEAVGEMTDGDHSGCVQLDLSRIQTLSGWGAASDGMSETVSLGDLIGSLDAVGRTMAGAEGELFLPLSDAALRAAAEGANVSTVTNRKEWAASEDEAIRKGVEQLGMRWRAIAAMLPGRSDDAVRNRWARLRNAGCKPLTVPRVKRDGAEQRQSWTREEDAVIQSSVAEFGHRWNRIAERLPKRTEHAIRNRWHRLQTSTSQDPEQAQSKLLIPAGTCSGVDEIGEIFAGFNSVVEGNAS